MSEDDKNVYSDAEFFPTPRNVVYSLLESPLVTLPGGTWIEPCAGSGRIISAVNDVRSDVEWVACELNNLFEPQISNVLKAKDILLPFGDFVHREWEIPLADVLIMNPPFTLTMQFVLAALQRARWVVCLQRRGWLGSVARAPWQASHYPDTHHLSWRPSFRPDGKTDLHDYTWYVWPPGSITGRDHGISSLLTKPTANQIELFPEPL